MIYMHSGRNNTAIPNFSTPQYRFFNLQNEEKPWELMVIPAKARPKEGESIKID